jgi:hypothetical protein
MALHDDKVIRTERREVILMKVFVVEVIEEIDKEGKDIDMMQMVTDALDAQQLEAVVFDYESYLKGGDPT